MPETDTVPREDYDALEASLAMAEELAAQQAARIVELEALVGLLSRRAVELQERINRLEDDGA